VRSTPHRPQAPTHPLTHTGEHRGAAHIGMCNTAVRLTHLRVLHTARSHSYAYAYGFRFSGECLA